MFHRFSKESMKFFQKTNGMRAKHRETGGGVEMMGGSGEETRRERVERKANGNGILIDYAV